MRAWLFTILRNTFLSERRKRKREVEDVDGALTIGLSVHPEQPGHMDMVDFRRALSRLSDEQREALILVGAEGFSYEEAAQVCDCAVGTIKSRVNRARASLTQALQLRDGTEFGPSATVAAIIGELPR
jgi:RNA polymerase sigma-70 factor (ECF subfamily)